MILFGLSRGYKHFNKKEYLDALTKACNWILQQLDDDGIWRSASYQKGFSPAYYSRVIWGMLESSPLIGTEGLRNKMEQVLQAYLDWTLPQWDSQKLGVSPWSFCIYPYDRLYFAWVLGSGDNIGK